VQHQRHVNADVSTIFFIFFFILRTFYFKKKIKKFKGGSRPALGVAKPLGVVWQLSRAKVKNK
jgi:hypothetical protein